MKIYTEFASNKAYEDPFGKCRSNWVYFYNTYEYIQDISVFISNHMNTQSNMSNKMS